MADDSDDSDQALVPASVLSRGARTKPSKICRSLIEHWPGLTLFVEYPEVPMANHLAENSLRTPVTGRNNYYGSGSVLRAQRAAWWFSILQTLGLWGINPRPWLTDYLIACAANGGRPPETMDPYLPWFGADRSPLGPRQLTDSRVSPATPWQTLH